MLFFKNEHHKNEFDTLFHILKTLCSQRAVSTASLPVESWPSTREIAECCGFDIYKARYMLLKLAEKGKVCVSPAPVNRSLRWFIADAVPEFAESSQGHES